MAAKVAQAKTAGVSDAAVQKATGRSWAEWLKILDAAGARRMSHKEIAKHLDNAYPALGGWWAQMITVGYEQARGLREPNQQAGGYVAHATKTVAVPVEQLFAAWQDVRHRRRWLGESALTIHKATPPKSIRGRWTTDDTRVNVYFCGKGETKSQVAVQHEKLADARAVARMKRFWSERLTALKERLEA